METGIIVQARMGSTRLPGKVMHEIDGKPLLQYLIERLRRCCIPDTVIVATSIDGIDDSIAELCEDLGISYWRGDCENVASRFKDIIEHWNLDAFIRLSGDSPLLDHVLIDEYYPIFCKIPCDLLTNLFPRTYPKGQSIEFFRSQVFLNGYSMMEDKDDLEHVTTFFYKKYLDFNIHNISCDTDFSHLQLSVDTPEDLMNFKRIIAHMEKPHWQYRLSEVVELYRQVAKY